MKKTDIVIIGSGMAGITAAVYLKRANANFVLLEGNLAGGMLNQLKSIENFPAMANTTGPDILIALMDQLRFNDIPITYGNVQTILKEEDGFEVVTDFESYETKTVIIATGVSQSNATIPGEEKYAGQGVSYCATCDGNFFKDFPLKGQHNYVMGPRYHEYMHELNQRAFGRYDTMTVGEAAGITFKDAFKSIDESVEELDSVFTFEHVNADMYMQVFPHKLNLVKWKKILSNWQTLPLTSQPTLFLENHDQPRSWPRFVMYEKENRELACKMLLVAMQMMRGTAYVYQGQEIGMTNIKLKEEEYIDIMATRIFGTIRKSAPFLMPIARSAMAKRARDHARTPMQWDDSELTGFTTGKPWMLINPNHVDINVKKQDKDEDSILNFYRKFIHFRIGKDIIISGSYVPYYEKSKDLFVYARVLGKKAYFTICNFKNKEINFKVPQDLKFKSSKVAITNYKEPISNTLESRKIAPFEAVVYELKLE